MGRNCAYSECMYILRTGGAPCPSRWLTWRPHEASCCSSSSRWAISGPVRFPPFHAAVEGLLVTVPARIVRATLSSGCSARSRGRAWRSRSLHRPHFARRPRRSPSSIGFKIWPRRLTALNEQICRVRPAEPDEGGWTEAGKKRLLLFIKKSHGKSRRFSR